MKKTLIALLCVAMLVCFAVSAAAAGGSAALSASATEIKAGGTVTFTVSIAGVPELKSGGADIIFDKTALSLADGAWSSNVEDHKNMMMVDFDADDNKFAMMTKMGKTADVNGEFVTFTLKAADTIAPGEYEVKVSLPLVDVNGKFILDASAKLTVVCEHTYGSALVNTDAAEHWYECSKCGHKKDVAGHAFDNACDAKCDTCGYTRTPAEHQWTTTMKTDGAKHWNECTVCSLKKDEGTHTGGTATCKDKAVCTTCNTAYGELAAHKPTEKVADKYLVSAADCKNAAVYKKSCEVCEIALAETFKYGNPSSHLWPTEYKTDGTKHWKECPGCGLKKDEGVHAGGNATCKDKAVCDTCNKGYGELAAHKPVEVVAEKFLKSEANCVSKAVYYKSCEVCEIALTETFENGEKNADKHADAEPVFKGAEPATCEKDGKTGDKHCGACDAKLADSEPIIGGHKLTKVSAAPADCENAGNIEYYVCSGDCGKLYKDAEAKEAFEKAEDVVVKATGHKLTKVEKVDSTTAKTGTEEHYKCDTCAKLYKDAEGKTEIKDIKDIEIAKKPAGGNPQTGANVALIVVAVVALLGSVATIPAVVSKKR